MDGRVPTQRSKKNEDDDYSDRPRPLRFAEHEHLTACAAHPTVDVFEARENAKKARYGNCFDMSRAVADPIQLAVRFDRGCCAVIAKAAHFRTWTNPVSTRIW